MKEIILKGTAYQRGFKHGKTFAKEIKYCYDMICRKIKEKWNKKKEKLLQQLFENIKTEFSDLEDEIKGISEGSEMNFEDVLLLNFYHGLEAINFQCTNLSFINEKQGAIHGKTGDSEDYLSPFYLLEVVFPDKGPSFINFCFVGTVWTEAGMNTLGLSCGQSSSSTINGQDGRGISCLTLPRPLLQKCSNVEEGIEFLSKYPMSGKGLNILISDSKGNAAVVEKSYTKQAVRKIENGCVWNTNHFLDKELAKYNFTRGAGLKNSKDRYNYLEDILKKENVPHTTEEMKKILRNHKEPGAICRHPNKGDKNGTRTHFGAIFIPKEKTALITHGNPCENEYKVYKIGSVNNRKSSGTLFVPISKHSLTRNQRRCLIRVVR